MAFLYLLMRWTQSSTEFRDIDAVWAKRKLRLIPLANISELRYIDAVRTIVRTAVLTLHICTNTPIYARSYVIMKRIFCLRRIYEKHSMLFILGIMLGIVLMSTIYYASDGLVCHRCWFVMWAFWDYWLATTSHLAIFSPFAIQFAKKLGIELLFLVLISDYDRFAIRITNLPFLYLGNLPQCAASKPDFRRTDPAN